MYIQEEYSLLKHNTFGIDAKARWFVSYDCVEDLALLLRDEYFQECRSLHIGEGSNLLFLSHFDGIILHSQICSIELYRETEDTVWLRVGAGLPWDRLVEYTVEQGYWGAENLSLIPGQVGSAAIQNIGAYGVEVSELIDRVETINKDTGEQKVFVNRECSYSYRYSIFKEHEYQSYIITHVVFKFSKTSQSNLEYEELRAYLQRGEIPVSLRAIREVVVAIRRSKLPDHHELGNAGSFFMNPILSPDKANRLVEQYRDIPCYTLPDGRVKTSAAWLIERCGLKGYRKGNVGIYDKHALVLVNHGGATGKEVASFASDIQVAVYNTFEVELIPEVLYVS